LKSYVALDQPSLWQPELSSKAQAQAQAQAQAIIDNPDSVSAEVRAAGVEEEDKLKLWLNDSSECLNRPRLASYYSVPLVWWNVA
jgi:hypothetical protein